jgi:hypothetical protein
LLGGKRKGNGDRLQEGGVRGEGRGKKKRQRALQTHAHFYELDQTSTSIC